MARAESTSGHDDAGIAEAVGIVNASARPMMVAVVLVIGAVSFLVGLQLRAYVCRGRIDCAKRGPEGQEGVAGAIRPGRMIETTPNIGAPVKTTR
jgi:hypothetical protein